jgi:hypothetical protein
MLLDCGTFNDISVPMSVSSNYGIDEEGECVCLPAAWKANNAKLTNIEQKCNGAKNHRSFSLGRPSFEIFGSYNRYDHNFVRDPCLRTRSQKHSRARSACAFHPHHGQFCCLLSLNLND